MRLSEEIARELCQRLLEYDPNIVEIIQFGSSIYAPEYARDVDILLFTAAERGYSGYLESLAGFEFPFDVVVKRAGEVLEGSLARQVLGAYRVLYGSGNYLRRSSEALKDPGFEEAWEAIETAKGLMADAREEVRRGVKDRYLRIAFNELFHAARIASMAYLATEESRWGEIKRRLPPRYREEFDKYIKTLHVQYFYEGRFPREMVEEEFEAWLKRVEDYVRGLEA